jgi:tRNA threonylcarbamoyladenosine biosynthesis protein TsaE
MTIREMEHLASLISKELFSGFVLCLEGDLGAGKTTFTKFLGKGMGVTDVINSPTFTIMKIYNGEWDLYHMDVYRLAGIGADYDLEDYIYGDGVCVIEWYKHIEESLPQDRLTIDIKIIGETARLLTIEGTGKYEQIVKKIDS